MAAPSVQFETRGPIALVMLNRPDANALNLQMAMDLLAAAMTCARTAAVRAVVLTGAGRHFCFGGDLRAMANRDSRGDHYVRELTTYLHAAIAHFMRMDAPVIAAVNGTAAGAGVGLAAMADLAVCARSSKFNLAYTNSGLTPDAGTSFLLPRTVGVKRAMELLLLNRTLTATEAHAWGLVNEVVADEQLLARALEIAGQLAQGARAAFGATKRLVSQALGALESQMMLESETIGAQAVSPEGMEGISAFLQKRKPQFPDQGPG